MRQAHYLLIGTIINGLPDQIRATVADHFATEFNKRSPSFDPMAWERKTGGRPAPGSAHP